MPKNERKPSVISVSYLLFKLVLIVRPSFHVFIRYGFAVAYGFMYTKMLTAWLILSKLGFYAHAKPVI